MKTQISSNARKPQVRGKPHPTQGFTLVELLVVIGIVALLASLLLPALANAKTTARFAKCKGNLRQLALAMNAYVTDHARYPNFGTWTTIVLWAGLNEWNSKLAADPTAVPDFRRWPECTEPIRPRAQNSGLLNYPYWYNTLGSLPFDANWGPGRNDCGLGLAKRTNPLTLPWGVAVRENDVVEPADMVAFSDSVASNGCGPPQTGREPFYPHRDRTGAAYCDAHVGVWSRRDFLSSPGPTNHIWRQWNRDHEVHPEASW